MESAYISRFASGIAACNLSSSAKSSRTSSNYGNVPFARFNSAFIISRAEFARHFYDNGEFFHPAFVTESRIRCTVSHRCVILSRESACCCASATCTRFPRAHSCYRQLPLRSLSNRIFLCQKCRARCITVAVDRVDFSNFLVREHSHRGPFALNLSIDPKGEIIKLAFISLENFLPWEL